MLELYINIIRNIISKVTLKVSSVSRQLSETFRLPIETQRILITQTSGFRHSVAHCLISLETEFQFSDALRRIMTPKILERAIYESSDKKVNFRTALLSCTLWRTNYRTGRLLLHITLP